MGIIIEGEQAGNYIAVQASEVEGWDVLISRNNKRRISVGYPATSDHRLRALLSQWGVRWLPQGIYADAVTSRFFQRAAQGEKAL